MSCSHSEADVRAKGDAQIVVRPAREINLIRDIKAQTHRSEMSLNSTARVKDAHDVIVPQIADVTEERAQRRGAIAEVEVHETPFELHERMDMPVLAKIDLGAELAMQDANAGTVNAHGAR